MRNGMDSVFGLHHFAHAHNAEVGADSLGGMDARSQHEVAREPLSGSRPRRRDTVAFRDEVRAFLRRARARPAAAVDGHAPRASPPTASGSTRWPTRGCRSCRGPRQLGGRDASLLQWVVFEEEYFAAGAPLRVSQNGIFLLAPTLFAHGTAGAAGPHPAADGAGRRDLGAGLVGARGRQRPGRHAQSRAVRTDGGWLLSGQKTWSTRATYADRGFGLFRTDPDAERHRGLTYFLFDLRADGVTVRGIPQLDGEPGFAEIFLDDVFVPDADVLGGVGDGWRVAMSTARNERGLSLRRPGRFLAAASRLVDARPTGCDRHARSTDRRGRRVDRGPGLPAAHLGDGHPPGRRRRARAPSRASASCSGPSWMSRCTRRRWTCSAPRASWPATGWTATCSRCRPDLRRHQRDPAQRRGRAAAGAAAMRVRPVARAAGLRRRSLRELLAKSDVPAVVRAWAAGDIAPGPQAVDAAGRAGSPALGRSSGRRFGATAVDLVVAFEELGRAAVPGPCVESVAVLPALLGGTDGDELTAHRPGELVATVAAPPHVPFARRRRGGRRRLSRSTAATLSTASVTATARVRRPVPACWPRCVPADIVGRRSTPTRGLRPRRPGHGRAVARRRRGAARAQHRVRAAAPAVRPADRRLPGGQAPAGRRRRRASSSPARCSRRRPRRRRRPASRRGTSSAAKVACGDAAYRASRAALQVHGAIGYTAEYDLSLWLTKVRALVSAWGTPAGATARGCWRRSRGRPMQRCSPTSSGRCATPSVRCWPSGPTAPRCGRRRRPRPATTNRTVGGAVRADRRRRARRRPSSTAASAPAAVETAS